MGASAGSFAGCSALGPRMMSSFDAPAGTIGKHISRWVHAEVDHDAAVGDGQRLLDHGVDLVRVLGAQADASVGLGELHVVRRVVRQVHLAVALVVEQLLPLAHHAQVARC